MPVLRSTVLFFFFYMCWGSSAAHCSHPCLPSWHLNMLTELPCSRLLLQHSREGCLQPMLPLDSVRPQPTSMSGVTVVRLLAQPTRHWGNTLLNRPLEDPLEIASAVFGLLQRRARPRLRPPLDWGSFPEAGGGNDSSESEGAQLVWGLASALVSWEKAEVHERKRYLARCSSLSMSCSSHYMSPADAAARRNSCKSRVCASSAPLREQLWCDVARRACKARTAA